MLAHVALQSEDTDDGGGHARRLVPPHVPPPRAFETPARWADEKPARCRHGRSRGIADRTAAVAASPSAEARGTGARQNAAARCRCTRRSSPEPPAGPCARCSACQRHAVRTGDRRRLLRPGDEGRDQGAHGQLRGRHRDPFPGPHLVLDDPVLPVPPPPRPRARRLRHPRQDAPNGALRAVA